MISVINKKYTFFVGRPSPLGNPFVIGKNGARDEVIADYEIWLREQIQNKNPKVCDELNKIYKTALDCNVLLMCFCCPENCHGNVIVKVLLEKAKENGKIDLICEDKNK